MALGIWKKKRIVRRFDASKMINGHQTSGFTDSVAVIDVQTTSSTGKTDTDGDEHVQRLKAFGDYQMRVADIDNGVKADLLWFQGRWFECIASRLSENTFLKHWTSEFVECLNQPEKPNEEVLLK